MNPQPQQQRHKTSMFSQYDNNSNNSISSKQLEYWLMQMAPTSHTSPKFHKQNINTEWNLVSTSSRYETDGMTFGQSQGGTFGQRLGTFESGNKENVMSKGNLLVIDNVKQLKDSNQQHYQSEKEDKLTKSKSYINAMQQLQKRAKTLEQQNSNMRKSMQLLQQEKMSSLQSSMVYEQQMRNKVSKYEDTDKRVEELRKENKRLRDNKNEQSLKIKLMEKAINEQKSMVKEVQQRLDMLSHENQRLKIQLTEANNMTKALLTENKQLAVRSETLENMKEKSTHSVLEKYAKALERIQELQLDFGEMKNRTNAMDEKNKKIIEQKDHKYLESLEKINGLKLEKQQLSMRLQNSALQSHEKGNRNSEYHSKIKQLEQTCSEKNRQVIHYKTKLESSEQKYSNLSQKFSRIQVKCKQLQYKLKVQQDMAKQQERLKQQQKNQKRASKIQHKDSLDSPIQENQQSMNELLEQQQYSDQQENTPVERYDSNQDEDDQNELQEFNTFTKPLSIIVNAKVTQSKIKSEEDKQQNDNTNQNQSEEDDDTLTNQKYNQLKNSRENPITKKLNQKQNNPKSKNSPQTVKIQDQKQTVKQRKSTTNQAPSRRNSNSRESKQSTGSNKNSQKEPTTYRQKSPQQTKYKIPSLQKQNKRRNKKSSFTIDLQQNQSKCSSIQKRKSNEKKRTSVDSKKSSHSVSKQQSSSHSRLINQKTPLEQVYMCQSAQPTRYPGNERYYYSGEINTRHLPLNHIEIQPQSFHNTSFLPQNNTSFLPQNNTSFLPQNNTTLMTHDSKNQLNKALLLQYQEQALKLYEEHERLLEISQEENISTQERAEILGRIKQVMLMIDHNTEKIFSIRGNAE